MAKAQSPMLPGMEQMPSMPEGYYSGDKPNPELNSFVRNFHHPYSDEEDNYNASAFNKAISTTKATAIYNMHTYWSKKPHDAIQKYIKHYTEIGDLVLDPFCGSGGTALASLLDARKAIAIDRSPAATFITKNYCTPIAPSRLEAAFLRVASAVKEEIEWLLETKCDRCDKRALVAYTVYSQTFQCPRCLERISLFSCIESVGTTGKGESKKINACPHCFSLGHVEEIRSQSKKYGAIPVLTSYICEGGCKPSRSQRSRYDDDSAKREYFLKYDIGKIEEIEAKPIPHPYPKGYSMEAFSRYQRDALFYYDVKEVADLYTKRNLWALAAIRKAILEHTDGLERDAMFFAFQSIVLINSRMCEAKNTQITKGTYYLPQISKEIRPLSSVENKVKAIAKAQPDLELTTTQLIISTQSCTDMLAIPSDSIDYIFTDPPYSHTVQYGELNYVWEAWLGFDSNWHHEEIIVNAVRGRTESDWAASMRRAMEECYRVLKPGRWLSLCYHDTSEGTWGLIQDVMAEVGFSVDKTDSVLFIDTKQKSHNQITADKTTKRDLVLNFRKPKPGDLALAEAFIPGDADVGTFRDMATRIIVEFLTAHPGATKDRVYDALVSRLVKRGLMEAHDFGELLSSVGDEVSEPVGTALSDTEVRSVSRWYVKEGSERLDQAETEKEDEAAERLEVFMLKKLKLRPEFEGVHYSDLFEQVITIPNERRPRRLFENWLPEYFFKTSEGTWRPPADETERQYKAAIREAGTLRKMKRFANTLLEGVPVRDQDRPDSARTLAEWIRQCRRAGLYEQGRVMYEKGGLDLDRLNEDEQIEVEDDYRICVKRGGEEDRPKKAKGSKKKR